MSKGRPIVTARLNADVHAALLADLERQQVNTADVPWDLAGWIAYAVKTTLAKRQRSRSWKPGRTWPGLKRMLAQSHKVPEGSDYGG